MSVKISWEYIKKSHSVPVGGVSTIPPTLSNSLYIKRVKRTTTMTELQTFQQLAQDLRNEVRNHEQKARNAQDCLNEVQRKLALLKLQAQMDTPMADMMGG